MGIFPHRHQGVFGPQLRKTRLRDAEFRAKALWAASITGMAQEGGGLGRRDR